MIKKPKKKKPKMVNAGIYGKVREGVFNVMCLMVGTKCKVEPFVLSEKNTLEAFKRVRKVLDRNNVPMSKRDLVIHPRWNYTISKTLGKRITKKICELEIKFLQEDLDKTAKELKRIKGSLAYKIFKYFIW